MWPTSRCTWSGVRNYAWMRWWDWNCRTQELKATA